jgi:hypothetical protein
MKKLKILFTVFLILLSVCVFVNMQTAKAAVPIVPAPTLNPSNSIGLGSSVTASVTISGSSGTPTGSVTFQYSINSGSSWTNLGTAVTLVGGSATSASYTPTAPGSNYQFRASYGGNVNYNSTIGGSVTLTVDKATATVGAASFVPASPIILGGSVTVSVSVSGPGGVSSPTGNVQFQVKIGAGSFTNFGSVGVLSGGSASISYTTQTATTYSFQAVYQGDGNYNSGTTGFPSGTLTVNKATPAITAPTLNPSGFVTVGTSVSISVNVPGGGAVPTGTATFQVNIGGGGWSNIGSAISLSSGSASTIYVPQSAGSYQFQVIYVGDSNYNSATSSAVSLTVNTGLTVGVSPVGPLTMDVGQTQLFTATASGGTGTKSYQWYFDGAVVSGQTALTYSYLSVLGSHTIYVRVTDNVPVIVQSNTVSVSGNSAPTVGVSPVGPLTMDVGQTQLFTATASGGTGSLFYQWYLDSAVVSGQTSSSYSYTGALGSHSIYARVTDSAFVPVTVQSNTVSVTVNSVLGVSVSPVSWVMDVGQSKLFTATPLGGSGIYSSYQWYVGSIAQSGKTSSTFNYSSALPGSYLITVSVTDSLGATSVQSSASSVVVSASPTVGVSPVGPLTMDVGQTQLFTATASGGTGTKSYQWYFDGAVVSGQISSSYSYTAVLGLHTIFVKVTDSAPTPVAVQSSTVSVTVNSVLAAPSVSASVGIITQGQTSVLSNSSLVTTGTSPYSYQWFSKPPSGSYSSILGATSSSYSFVTSIATATGTWSFMLQVKDAAGAVANSSAVSVTVNIPPLDHFVFSPIGAQTAGVPFTLIITAKDASNYTLVNYVGANILNVSTGSVSPVSTGVFSSGVWTGSVTVTGAGSEITLFTTGSGMSGTSGAFSVNADVLNRFTFSAVGSQIAGSAFNITVTAKDAFGNNVTGYTGTPSLTFSLGSINPDKMNPFVSGVGLTSVIVGDSGLDVNITVTDGVYSGISNNFAVSAVPTVGPAPTTAPNYSSTQTRTPTPTSKPTSVPTAMPPAPTPTLTAIKVRATMDDGAKVDLVVFGNMTISQILNVRIVEYQSSALTSVSFTVVGENGTAGFCNMTIPISVVSNGKSPVVFIDGAKALNQGYNQDADNFYVWFTTTFSIHHVTTQFTLPSISSSLSIGPLLAVGITVPEIVTIYIVIAIRRLRRTPDKI